MENAIKEKIINNYKKDGATDYIVSSSCELWTQRFKTIQDAAEYAVDNLDYKTFINEDGFFENKNDRDCESALYIYNNINNEDVFSKSED